MPFNTASRIICIHCSKTSLKVDHVNDHLLVLAVYFHMTWGHPCFMSSKYFVVACRACPVLSACLHSCISAACTCLHVHVHVHAHTHVHVQVYMSMSTCRCPCPRPFIFRSACPCQHVLVQQLVTAGAHVAHLAHVQPDDLGVIGPPITSLVRHVQMVGVKTKTLISSSMSMWCLCITLFCVCFSHVSFSGCSIVPQVFLVSPLRFPVIMSLYLCFPRKNPL